MQVIGSMLVHNEDVFVEQAIRNVAAFCDRIVVADHASTDGTPEILLDLARRLDHLEVRTITHSAESHAMIEELAGTETWILGVDGDELYDPVGLVTFRRQLESGSYDDVFRIRPAGLHCDELDVGAGRAYGYLSPPGRPLLGILNFAAIESWTNVRSQRLHGGDVVFRPGFGWDSWRHLGMELGWDAAPFRDLHVCFLPRSSRDEAGGGRPNLSETGNFRRGLLGPPERLLRRMLRRPTSIRGESDSSWKAEKYRRGPREAVDPSSFFATP